MMHRTVRTTAAVLVSAILLGLAMGCTPLWLASNAASFAAGWLAHDVSMLANGGDLTCYRNGVLTDCATLPAEFQPPGT